MPDTLRFVAIIGSPSIGKRGRGVTLRAPGSRFPLDGWRALLFIIIIVTKRGENGSHDLRQTNQAIPVMMKLLFYRSHANRWRVAG
jgi:hypothetical protein